MHRKTILAIDPSTTISGFCLGVPGRILESGILRGGTLKDTTARVNVQLVNLLQVLRRHNIGTLHALVVEKPSNWQSPRGMKAATSGALQELARAEGVFTTTISIGYCPKEVVTVEPIHWKGQLPKIVLFERMKKKYDLVMPATGANFNRSDAVGLFDWYLTEHQKKKLQ